MARHLGSGSLDYGNAANYRYVALLGACDDGIRSLAASLGWADDLDRLVASATALFAARAPPPPPELPPPRAALAAGAFASIGDLLVDDDENAAPVVFEQCVMEHRRVLFGSLRTRFAKLVGLGTLSFSQFAE